MNVGIIIHGFEGWAGGIRFIELILTGLGSVASKEGLNIYIIGVPNILRKTKGFVSYLKRNRTLNFFKYKDNLISNQEILKELFKNNIHFEYIEYWGTEKSLTRLVQKNNIKWIVPVMSPLSSCEINWIGYLTDCQHKYFPEYFGYNEIIERDKNIKKMLSLSKKIIVNATAVKIDLQNFYDISNAMKVYVLPFSPILSNELINSSFDTSYLNFYKLSPKKYFIVSNQFWEHKNHKTAFIAFKNFIDNSESNQKIKLVCTGSTTGQNSTKNYSSLLKLIKELKIEKNIVITELIDRNIQLALMGNSIALIQPTLFEGGPGGGAVFDAIGLGIRCIISDIPVNKEIENNKNITIFKSSSNKDLCDKMIEVYESDWERDSSKELFEESHKRAKILGNAILEIIH